MKVSLKEYHERRLRSALEGRPHREFCIPCRQPLFGCYCTELSEAAGGGPFDPAIEFAILIHPIEVKRRVATGRMAHRCLLGSRLIEGIDFSGDRTVREMINDPHRHCVVLYPGESSLNISRLAALERAEKFPTDKKLTIFVIDGTWRTARAMLRSPNLRSLPRISFDPTRESTFRIRKQPALGCLSTIEAIHQTIELMGDSRGFQTASRRHDVLMKVFDSMVTRQLRFNQGQESAFLSL